MLPASTRMGRPPRTRLRPILVALFALAAVISVGGSAGTALAVRASAGSTTAVFVADQRPSIRDGELRALLDRHAKAVLAKDRAAFLADVDRSDPGFARHEEQEFDNLTKLPLADFSYALVQARDYGELVPGALIARFHSGIDAAAVEVRYKIQGLDATATATPWVPIFGLARGVWRLAGQATGSALPMGAGGQPWDGGPITVATGARVVAVASTEDAGRAQSLVKMSEAALDRVAAVRPGGWPGKVLVTAVQDPKVFQTYFAESPDRINQVAAIAVPYYTSVPAWHGSAEYAATRVVFNPNQLDADEGELSHDLAHEFTHAAMGGYTSGTTPLWLVEGFAEYVAFKPAPPQSAALHRALTGLKTDALPADSSFYGDALNYVLAYLACRMIAERYGQAKLLALYETFADGTTVASTGISRVLGVDQATLTALWAKYVERARTATLP
jgi:hypothetical protein